MKPNNNNKKMRKKNQTKRNYDYALGRIKALKSDENERNHLKIAVHIVAYVLA